MPLSRADRFRMKSEIATRIDVGGGWSWPQIELLLGEFGLEMGEGSREQAVGVALAQVEDAALIELYSIVMEVPLDDVTDELEGDPHGNWKPGYLRLFLSHSAVHKAWVSDVSNQLAVVGIHGFVAHDAMTVSRSWSQQIQQALRTMDALVLLNHPEVPTSAWCQTEVGWALGRRAPVFVVRLGADPVGPIADLQWPSHAGDTVERVAEIVGQWVYGLPGVGDRIADGLIARLGEAMNFNDAGAAASRIAALPNLSDELWQRLAAVFWSNDQAYGSVLVRNALAPFYAQQGRVFPPERLPE